MYLNFLGSLSKIPEQLTETIIARLKRFYTNIVPTNFYKKRSNLISLTFLHVPPDRTL